VCLPLGGKGGVSTFVQQKGGVSGFGATAERRDLARRVRDGGRG
jgi:hypothetical protein